LIFKEKEKMIGADAVFKPEGKEKKEERTEKVEKRPLNPGK
jgi:hypothetical protein